jgi:hypothetical protein
MTTSRVSHNTADSLARPAPKLLHGAANAADGLHLPQQRCVCPCVQGRVQQQAWMSCTQLQAVSQTYCVWRCTATRKQERARNCTSDRMGYCRCTAQHGCFPHAWGRSEATKCKGGIVFCIGARRLQIACFVAVVRPERRPCPRESWALRASVTTMILGSRYKIDCEQLPVWITVVIKPCLLMSAWAQLQPRNRPASVQKWCSTGKHTPRASKQQATKPAITATH